MSFKILNILYRLNYSGFYYVYYHRNVATVLELHFSQLLSSKLILRCVLKCKKFSSHFFHVNPYYLVLVYLMTIYIHIYTVYNVACAQNNYYTGGYIVLISSKHYCESFMYIAAMQLLRICNVNRYLPMHMDILHAHVSVNTNKTVVYLLAGIKLHLSM